jgi:hypothetical protein
VQPDEADDVAVWRVGLPVRRRRDHPRRVHPFTGQCQQPAVHQLVQRELHHCQPDPWEKL